MIDVREAEALIAANVTALPNEVVALEKSVGRILARNVMAERDQPPFHRVAMDGITICYSAWEKGVRVFSVDGIQKAGEPQKKLSDSNHCLEVMTGAILPEGCDCVIRVEDVNFHVEGSQASLVENLVLQKMQNVHLAAQDYRQGDLVLAANGLIEAAEVGILASNGVADVEVLGSPKVAIISTGDELVGLQDKLAPYQIRRSNAWAIQSALHAQQLCNTKLFHLVDEEESIFQSLKSILAEFDVLILSGGVSMGKFDFLPKVLSDLKVKKVFHKIKQRPGKPFWFGVGEAKQAVFALPGNPVSTLVCLYRYVLPTLMQAKMPICYAELDQEIVFAKDLTYFTSVKIHSNAQAKVVASPIIGNGSGDFSALANTDGFIELKRAQSVFPKGYVVPVFLWNSFHDWRVQR